MAHKSHQKYQRVLQIISDVAQCADGRLILVGGTALAVFYLKHRASVDIDFVPVERHPEEDVMLKQAVKGCLTKKGYRTMPARHHNQFVVQFEDTSIKVEIFIPNNPVKSVVEHDLAKAKLKVASLDDLLSMKIEAYANRKAARDIFDIIFILKEKNLPFDLVKELISKHGLPAEIESMQNMVFRKADYEFFKEVLNDNSKTSIQP